MAPKFEKKWRQKSPKCPRNLREKMAPKFERKNGAKNVPEISKRFPARSGDFFSAGPSNLQICVSLQKMSQPAIHRKPINDQTFFQRTRTYTVQSCPKELKVKKKCSDVKINF
jgi:hypothetical protein